MGEFIVNLLGVWVGHVGEPDSLAWRVMCMYICFLMSMCMMEYMYIIVIIIIMVIFKCYFSGELIALS